MTRRDAENAEDAQRGSKRTEEALTSEWISNLSFSREVQLLADSVLARGNPDE